MAARGEEDLADEFLVAEAEGLDDVCLGDVARYSDMFVPIGRQDVLFPVGLGDHEGGEHGDVAEEEGEFEAGCVRRSRRPRGFGLLGFHLFALVFQGGAVAFGVYGKGVGCWLGEFGSSNAEAGWCAEGERGRGEGRHEERE